MICDHWTQSRRRGPRGHAIWGLPHRCTNPARFRVSGRPDPITRAPTVSMSGETPCGVHVRPYLMDNGDSVWKPWIVEPLRDA